MQQQPQQIQDFFRRTDPAGEHDNAMAGAHEGLQALLDIRHDDQLVNDGVRGLCADNARLGDADVTAVFDPLFGMADSGTLHRAFHGTRSAAGTDTEPAQAQLMAHFLTVDILGTADGMAAPAHDQVR